MQELARKVEYSSGMGRAGRWVHWGRRTAGHGQGTAFSMAAAGMVGDLGGQEGDMWVWSCVVTRIRWSLGVTAQPDHWGPFLHRKE